MARGSGLLYGRRMSGEGFGVFGPGRRGRDKPLSKEKVTDEPELCLCEQCNSFEADSFHVASGKMVCERCEGEVMNEYQDARLRPLDAVTKEED